MRPKLIEGLWVQLWSRKGKLPKRHVRKIKIDLNSPKGTKFNILSRF